MTDPMYNPQTGHGVECLCDKCMRFVRYALHRMDHGKDVELLEIEKVAADGSRVIKRVITDGVSTKDGLS